MEQKLLPVCVRLNGIDVARFQLAYPKQMSEYIRFCISEVLESPERWQKFKAYQQMKLKHSI